MKHSKLFLLAIVGVALVVSGCGKKSADQSLAGTGFEGIGPNDELSQLPQATALNQQAGVEVLPIENSPMTQPLSAPIQATTGGASLESLSREQKIQTALKNAGLYTGNIDGKIGPMTKKAIQTFQTNNGLTADGKVGSKTWAALEPYLNGAQAAASTSSVQ